MFDDFDNALSEFNLVQVKDFNTWSRLVGADVRSSLLDHVYIKDPTVLSNVKFTNPFFGDHVLVEFQVNAVIKMADPVKRRNWRGYSKETLINKLTGVDWKIEINDVQQYWNVFESKLIKIIDDIVPLVDYVNDVIKEKTPKLIKNKINKRNRLLKNLKKRP